MSQHALYAAHARDRYGFWLTPGPDGRLHVYVPAGQDHDGSPLTMARPATLLEITLWEQGRLAELARHLRAELPTDHLPMPAPQHPPRGTWKGFLARLKALARLGR